jgi:hypothetical protein
MHPHHRNSLNRPQMVSAIQRIVEVHAELMQAMNQNLITSDSKELPPGMQQLLDDHPRMVKMMPQILASTNLLQDHQCNRKMEKEIKTTMPVCKICGEAGHPSEECPEKCHRCTTSHSTRECPRDKVTCFVMESTTYPRNASSTSLYNK